MAHAFGGCHQHGGDCGKEWEIMLSLIGIPYWKQCFGFGVISPTFIRKPKLRSLSLWKNWNVTSLILSPSPSFPLLVVRTTSDGKLGKGLGTRLGCQYLIAHQECFWFLLSHKCCYTVSVMVFVYIIENVLEILYYTFYVIAIFTFWGMLMYSANVNLSTSLLECAWKFACVRVRAWKINEPHLPDMQRQARCYIKSTTMQNMLHVTGMTRHVD